MAINNNIQDPSTQGIGGLNGLQSIDAANKEQERILQEEQQRLAEAVSRAYDYTGQMSGYQRAAYQSALDENAFMNSHHTELGLDPELSEVGKSKYDKEVQTVDDLYNISNFRGEQQSGFSQIGVGLAKAAGIFATSFIDNTVGFLAGIEQGIYNVASDENQDKFITGYDESGNPVYTSGFNKFINGLVDNPISNNLRELEGKLETALPSYYTDRERYLEEHWTDSWENAFENLWSTNFIGDKVIKNSGFMAAAAASAYLSPVGGISKQLVKAGAITARTGRALAFGVNGFISGLQESKIEGSNAAKEFREAQISELNNLYAPYLNLMGAEASTNTDGSLKFTNLEDPMTSAALVDYNRAIQEINRAAVTVGNADFLLNIPLTTLTNMVVLGTSLKGGFRTASRMGNTIRNGSTFSGAMTNTKAVVKTAWSGLGEGVQEWSQSAAQKISNDVAKGGLSNTSFVEHSLDPEASEMSVNYLKSFASGINEAWNSPQSWEEALIGAITGFGHVGVRNYKGENGKWQVPLTIAVAESAKDNFRQVKTDKAAAEALNKIIQSPEFKNYWEGTVRNFKFENDKDAALAAGNEFDYRNADFAQFFNAVNTFSNAGQLPYLKDYIKDLTENLTDEQISDIIENTAQPAVDKNGNTIIVGPFIDAKGNKMSIDKARNKMLKSLKKMNDFMNDFEEARDNIAVSMKNSNYTDDAITELAFIKMQQKDWRRRGVDIFNDLKTTFKDLQKQHNKVIKDLKKKLSKTKKESERESIENQIEAIENGLNIINDIYSADSEDVFNYFSSTPENVEVIEAIKKAINELGVENSNIDRAESIKKIYDLNKISDGLTELSLKYLSVLADPTSIDKAKEKAAETANKKANKKATKNAVDKLGTAKNIHELEDLIKSENIENVDNVLDNLLEDGTEEQKRLVKEYRKTQEYNNLVNKELDAIEDDNKKINAKKVYEEHRKKANNLAELSNSNDPIFTDSSENSPLYTEGIDPDIFFMQVIGLGQSISNAMQKVNASQAYKDLLTKYEKPLQKNPKTETSTTSTTGKSEASTAPSTKGSTLTQEQINNLRKVNNIEKIIEDITKAVDNGDTAKALELINSLRGIYKANPTIFKQSEIDYLSNITKTIVPNSKGLESAKSSSEETIVVESLAQVQNERKRATQQQLNNAKNKEQEQRGQKQYWFPNLSEMQRKGDKIVTTKEAIPGYTILWDYMQAHGVWDFINNGGIKVGQEVLFVIDPELNNRMESQYTDNGNRPPILIAVRDIEGNLQIIGNLQTAPSSVENIRGLKALEDRIYNNWKNSDQSKMYTHNETTTISKNMIGYISYTDKEESIEKFYHTNGESFEDETPIIGVVNASGELITNKPVNVETIISGGNIGGTSGAAYLLVKNNRGTYSPVRLYTSRFNSKEIKLGKKADEDTPIQAKIRKGLSTIGEAIELKREGRTAEAESKLAEAYNALNEVLYLRDIHINFRNTKSGDPAITIYKTVIGNDGNASYIGSGFFNLNKSSNDALLNNIYLKLQAFNVPIRVTTKSIADPSVSDKYIAELISSGVLTANLESPQVRGGWFTMNPLNDDGTAAVAANPKSAPIESKPTIPQNNPVGGTETVTLGKPVVVYNNGISTTVYVKNNKITDANGIDITSTFNPATFHTIMDILTLNEAFKNTSRGVVYKATLSSKYIPGTWLSLNGNYLNEESGILYDSSTGRRYTKDDPGYSLTKTVMEAAIKANTSPSSSSSTYKGNELTGVNTAGEYIEKNGKNIEEVSKSIVAKFKQASGIDAFATGSGMVDLLLDEYGKLLNIDLSQYKGSKNIDEAIKEIQTAFESFINMLKASESLESNTQELNNNQETVVSQDIAENNNSTITQEMQSQMDAIEQALGGVTESTQSSLESVPEVNIPNENATDVSTEDLMSDLGINLLTKGNAVLGRNLFEYIDEKSVQRVSLPEILNRVKESEKYGKFFEFLFGNTDLSDVNIHTANAGQYGEGLQGIVDTNSGNIYIVTNNTQDDEELARVIMHELVHVYSHKQYTSGSKAFRNRIDRLMSVAKQKYSEISHVDDFDYAFSSAHEFMSEAFSNNKFQAFLNSIPYTDKSKKSLFDKFVDIIKSLFGDKINQNSLLAEIMRSVGNYGAIDIRKVGVTTNRTHNNFNLTDYQKQYIRNYLKTVPKEHTKGHIDILIPGGKIVKVNYNPNQKSNVENRRDYDGFEVVKIIPAYSKLNFSQKEALQKGITKEELSYLSSTIIDYLNRCE